MPYKLFAGREVISISGDEKYEFLQGLVTNDVNKAKKGKLVYALFLTPQGRFLYDMFVFERDDKLFCDVQKSRKKELLAKLKMYKMRKAIDIVEERVQVYHSVKEGDYADPRSKKLGFRTYSTEKLSEDADLVEYHALRIKCKVPDADLDLTYLKSLPMDYELQKLGAIDFEKGCYVGQEVTARMNYRGKLRKTLKSFELLGSAPAKMEEIELEGKKIGTILGIVGKNGLGLMYKEGLERLQTSADGAPITADSKCELRIND